MSHRGEVVAWVVAWVMRISVMVWSGAAAR